MSLTDDLYAAAEPLWRAQLEHPFVRGLGDGTLEEERFKRWVLQDYRYLKEFARVFAWAVAKAADGDMADLLAALLPCAWGYVYIARALAEGSRPDDQRYVDWIEQYASDEFADAMTWLRAELDRLGADAGQEKRARLQEIFVVSSRYEERFWEMCWAGEAWG